MVIASNLVKNRNMINVIFFLNIQCIFSETGIQDRVCVLDPQFNLHLKRKQHVLNQGQLISAIFLPSITVNEHLLRTQAMMTLVSATKDMSQLCRFFFFFFGLYNGIRMHFKLTFLGIKGNHYFFMIRMNIIIVFFFLFKYKIIFQFLLYLCPLSE